MSLVKIIAVLLIVAGVAGFVYGEFSYTEKTHDAKVGPLEFSIKDKETVPIPTWASAGAIALGTLILLLGRRK